VSEPAAELPVVLVCAECGATSDDAAAGWRAYLDADDEVAVFCVAYASREFDEA
jgi:hypothetical protein